MYAFRIGCNKSPFMKFSPEHPHGNFSACYDINTKYLGITKDETIAVEVSPTQFQVGQAANRLFCSIPTPFQPLANPPLCISALYAKNLSCITSWCLLQIRKTSDVNLPTQISPDVWILITPLSTPILMLICPRNTTAFITIRKPLHVLRIPMACSTTASNFHLPLQISDFNLGH